MRNPLTSAPVWGSVATVIDRTVLPYLAGFALCVGSVLALAACTQGENQDSRPTPVAEAVALAPLT